MYFEKHKRHRPIELIANHRGRIARERAAAEESAVAAAVAAAARAAAAASDWDDDGLRGSNGDCGSGRRCSASPALRGSYDDPPAPRRSGSQAGSSLRRSGGTNGSGTLMPGSPSARCEAPVPRRSGGGSARQWRGRGGGSAGADGASSQECSEDDSMCEFVAEREREALIEHYCQQ